jgi:polysaccharide biosynthesis transport protein
MTTLADSYEMARSDALPAALAPPPAAAPPEEQSAVQMGEIWRIIKQRKLLVAISVIGLYALVAVITVVVWKWFPLYPSEALLELAPPLSNPMDILAKEVRPDYMANLIETETRKLKQLGLLQVVLTQPEIKDTSYYKYYNNDIERCLYDFQNDVACTSIRDTNLIRVRMACANPKESRLIVQTIVDRYLSQGRADTTQLFMERQEGLAVTRDRLIKERDQIRKTKEDFRATTHVPTMKGEQSVVGENIAYLTQQINELDAQATDFRAQVQALEGLSVRDLPVTPEMQLIIEADPILRYYRNQAETMDVEIAAASQTLMGPNHRQMQTLVGRRDNYMMKEAAKREELMDTLRNRQMDNLRTQLQRATAMESRLFEQRGEAEKAQQDMDQNIQKYAQFEADEKNKDDQINTIEQSLTSAQHVVEDKGQINRLTPVQSAREAVWPSRPNLWVFLGGGAVLALFGGLGLAFLREYTDKAVRTPIDVARHGHVSVLGCIPLLDDEEADIETIELATRQAPQSLVAEAFRQTRTNLVFSGPTESQRSLLVTSPGPGDGKTATAINLAVTLAHSNHKVLLVDCNFRRPALRAAFANTRPDGLSNVLIGQARLEDVVTNTGEANLDVVTSGPTPPSPAELLGSPYMREFIKEAIARYDRVIFDGPPVLLVSDALVLSRQVDGVILVARAVVNSKGALKRAREQLNRIGAHVLGGILNGVQVRPGGYLKQQYRDFYEYQSDETIPHELPPAPQTPALTAKGDQEDDA